MTTYFDQRASALRGDLDQEQIDAFEENLLADMVLVCESFRGEDVEFPPRLRSEVYRALRERLTAAWFGFERYRGPDYEDEAAHKQSLRELVETLHGLFHAAAHAGWEGGDSPWFPLGEMRSRFLDAVGEQEKKT